jgi:hypothetical protein
MDRFLAARLLTIIAALGLPSTVNATSASSQMGASSRGTLQLSLSVRPRIHLGVKPRSQQENRLNAEGLCVWSTSPSFRFGVSLQPASHGSGDPPPPTTLPAEALTSKSGVVCAANSRDLLGRVSPEPPQESLLLLVSPD